MFTIYHTGRQKKFGERNEAFEEAKEAIKNDRLPFEACDERSVNGEDGDERTNRSSNGVSLIMFYK